MSEIENLKIDGGATYTVGNQDIIANEWEASKTYVKDKSYVIHEHKLCVCNTTHTSTNPFDPTNWTEITVGDALGNLNGTTLPLTTNPADGTVSEAIGDLSDLTTTRQDSLVDAVNEVNEKALFKFGAFTKTYSVAANGSTSFSNDFITVPNGYRIGAIFGYSTGDADCLAVNVRPTDTGNYAFFISNKSGTAKSNLTFNCYLMFVNLDNVGT